MIKPITINPWLNCTTLNRFSFFNNNCYSETILAYMSHLIVPTLYLLKQELQAYPIDHE